MLMRVHVLALLAIFAVLPCLAATPDGSTKAKAIPLKQRDPAKAVEEEMVWMKKLFHYTPVRAAQDELADAVRSVKAGKKPVAHDWGHATMDYKGHVISYWWFPSSRGRKEVLFDTGALIDTPGEAVRQESARAEYMRRMMPTLKVQ